MDVRSLTLSSGGVSFWVSEPPTELGFPFAHHGVHNPMVAHHGVHNPMGRRHDVLTPVTQSDMRRGRLSVYVRSGLPPLFRQQAAGVDTSFNHLGWP